MLTTSRGTVSTDGQYMSMNTSANVYESEQRPAAEYSLDEITKKILGGNTGFATQEQDVDIADTSIAPSAKTMSYADDNISKYNLYKDGQAKVSTKSKTAAEMRIACVAFAVVVLTLAILIAVYSGATAESFSAIMALEQTQAAYNTTVEGLVAQVAEVDDATMLIKAQQIGYTMANETNTVYYQMPEMREAQNFNIERNWFDILCDAISGAFGG